MRATKKPVTDIIVSIIVQDRSVCFSVNPKYLLTSQKPLSLTCDNIEAPAAMTITISAFSGELNKAIERPHAWLDHFLMQEGGLQPEKPYTLYWVEGSLEEVKAIAEEYYRDALQNI